MLSALKATIAKHDRIAIEQTAFLEIEALDLDKKTKQATVLSAYPMQVEKTDML